MASRFWVYIDSKIQGPVEIPSLRKVPGFNLLTQVCVEGEQSWRMADEVIEIKSYFLSPPRLNSFALDTGNAAPRLDFISNPMLEELTLPELDPKEKKIDPLPTEKMAKVEAPGPAGAAGLRAVCDLCGYKNPRDVAVCMKCGEKLGAPKSAAPVTEKGPAAMTAALPSAGMGLPADLLAAAMPAPAPVRSASASAPATEVDLKAGTMVEIPMSKVIMGIAMAGLIAGGAFFGFRTWKKKHAHQAPSAVPVAVEAPEPAHKTVRRSGKHYSHPQVHHHYVTAASQSPVDAAEPGAASDTTPPATDASPSGDRSEGSPYRVVAEATPLQKRYSSPVNSAYAVKRRANEELWSTQEGHAIQQVQRYRLYGGLRTVERNAEILMQVLRDREYNTAFESGKRISLYNDMDWSAVDKEGPVYEVRLTFSGGKEPDGAPKKPLHFAFAADLERGTVEPGGQDQIRSNTLHAFFDESRIAPEDRRAIARDTEELVLSAQPGASPLAFDTVVRQFAKVYGTDALSRVADAYGIREIKKKLEHDPRLGTEDAMEGVTAVTKTTKKSLPGLSDAPSKEMNQTFPQEKAPVDPAVAKNPFLSPPKGGQIDFRMEPGTGRERTFILRAVTHASPARIWEAVTGYDRLKQFMPDMIASEREGQDGAATIVHTVCLTHFMFFVFKVNLHLRVIEHPQQHSLEFERIAGDFESFRGAIEIGTDPATRDSQIVFHATVVPSGHALNWIMEGMARHLFVAQIDAIRLRAESQ